MQGVLSVVATPIGNLGDITLRALETLKKADVIFCEDTRVTAKLLARYEISKPLVRCDAHKEDAAAKKALELLIEGKRVVLVTDAGTPGISDPGARVVALARARDNRVEVIPGPSALTAALSIVGVPLSEFVFLGFLPHKKGRQTIFKEIAKEKRAVVFYESPHRIMKALESLVSTRREVVVCRELTKMYEEVLRGSPQEIIAGLKAKPGRARGEFVVVVH
ncbi:16S rRNA (cytidine(1402)-2'-O)-methyltransferase [Candidatus Kaiserbacteria bacterium RIFCSPHIGHO2_02_FULL_56_30]|uniref:Ribosomal RNA small subunit methyltransferase I n=1 Tax=Candidatus Kaiserbacteria bacterium RIFCSPHIGHO2_02_FULL_56_30 TaxID=1798499 RepID=A0A1F6E224_9BACT|nr:MAG: 16S rRNA (cytidine(1402)-2'-O)-methyltransferase [Candidatus Kaiserbacteria bacterium RIFCSPHIGHO2_02_FULL_56_30]